MLGYSWVHPHHHLLLLGDDNEHGGVRILKEADRFSLKRNRYRKKKMVLSDPYYDHWRKRESVRKSICQFRKFQDELKSRFPGLDEYNHED